MAKKNISNEPLAASSNVTPARRRTPAKNAPANGGSQPTHAQIAEAAYFRHLNRGGAHGDQFADWVEAERELKSRS
jgi:hypothetical protein